jgi:tubulin-folding cofactor B
LPVTTDGRRGSVAYVGPIPEIPGGPALAPWVGVLLDEPVGKNDGSIAGKRYFDVPENKLRGVFVRPERVEVGNFKPELDDELDGLDDDMEEM